MNTTSITRRNFIKRTAATAVAAAFAVGAFDSYAFTDAPGSCYCWEITNITNGQIYNPGNNLWPAGSYKKVAADCSKNGSMVLDGHWDYNDETGNYKARVPGLIGPRSIPHRPPQPLAGITIC